MAKEKINLKAVLADIRERLIGVNLMELSRDSGMSQTTLHRIANESHDPRFGTVVELYEYLQRRRKPLPITRVRKLQRPAQSGE